MTAKPTPDPANQTQNLILHHGPHENAELPLTYEYGYKAGAALGSLRAEIEGHVRYTGEEGDPAVRTLLALLYALEDLPEAAPAVKAAITAWNDDSGNSAAHKPPTFP